MNSKQRLIVELMERVQNVKGREDAVLCARDCLLQWERGGGDLLYKTVEAWDTHLADARKETTVENKESRHGAWVPAIPA